MLLLRAVIDAGGNQCTAAQAAGVHRNTVNRLLRGAGYDMNSLKHLAKARNAEAQCKQPASEQGASNKERQTA